VSAIIPLLLVFGMLIALFVGLTETKVKEEVSKKLDQDSVGAGSENGR
jgi:hypothetical protein